MTPLRAAYLASAEAATSLIHEPAVAASWPAPSALSLLSVGGLAAHLAGQITYVARALEDPNPPEEPVTLLEHYARARWPGAALDAEINVEIRDNGEAAAADGAVAVARRAAESLSKLRARLAVEPPDRVVRPPAGPWGLRLDDFLVTRMMEIVVHSDDLAFSVALPTPEFPPDVVEPVIALLSSLALRRHGATALVRALSRSERAPDTVSAF